MLQEQRLSRPDDSIPASSPNQFLNIGQQLSTNRRCPLGIAIFGEGNTFHRAVHAPGLSLGLDLLDEENRRT